MQENKEKGHWSKDALRSYLWGYQGLMDDIKDITEINESEWSLLMSANPSIIKTAVQSNSNKEDVMADRMSIIIDNEEFINKLLEDLFWRKKRIEQMISMLEQPQRRIIRLRYLKRMSWEDICNEIHLSRTSANDLMNSAINNILDNI